MTIKEVEKKLNISRANIRFYEKEGLLEPKRNENEYRNYSDDDIKRLEQIILFRKCNISIEDIRLIFNGSKNLDEVFKKQISVIENEVKQLEGAKVMCKKLSQEKVSINNLNTNEYLNIMNNEESKGNRFYNITEDYIHATEKLYQSIIENKEFKGGDKMKKGIRVGVYLASFVFMILMFILFDIILNNSIDFEDAICFAAIFTVVDLLGVKKYIEKKSGKEFTKKDNINHFIMVVVIMAIFLLGYLTIKAIYEVNANPKDVILEMSVKKSLIDIAQGEYVSEENNIYAESHKIIDYKVNDDEIIVYVMADYGLLNKENCEVISDTKSDLTLIYKYDKNSEGTYDLIEYNNSIPNKIKDKLNINYEDKYFKEQLNSYCNK